jgi:hypothetical protein
MKKNTRLPTLFILLIVGGFLTACEQNQPNSGLPSPVVAQKYATATTLHGTISDNNGIVTAGTVKALTAGGQLINSVTLQNSKEYALEIPANTALPLILSFSPDAAQSKGEDFIAVVIHASISKYDINPLTTAIAKKAMALGGYTDANLRQAAESSSSVQRANNGASVDQTKATQHYGGWH